MDLHWITTFLTGQPLLALFLTIAVGYALGALQVKGLALGSGAVLFVGLAVGAAVPDLKLPPLLGHIGLLLFLYGVGIAYGAQFLRGLSSAEGLKANLAALLAVGLALALALAAVHWLPGVAMAQALGAFAGAGTSTAALQAALAAFGTDAAIGYSVAYPVGVAVPILLLALYKAIRKPVLEHHPAPTLHTDEVAVEEFAVLGLPLGRLAGDLPRGVTVAAVRRAHHNLPAEDGLELQRGDVLLLAGTDPAALRDAAMRFGHGGASRLLRDRSELDYNRFFVSNPAVAGRPLAEVPLPHDLDARILHLRRSDADLDVRPGRRYEFGDRVGVLAPRASFPALARFFGDSVRGTGEINYIALGVGVTLGLAFGAIAWSIPFVGRFSFGFAGLLLVALLLGWRRRTGRLQWTMPVSANLVLRNFGLTLFLAVVGVSSGATFAAAIAHNGLLYLALGSAVVAVLVIVTLLLAVGLFRLPFDTAAGVVAGVTGNPAILGFANRIAPTDRPDIGYAMIFPSMTVVKILVVQLVAVWGR